MELSTHCLSEQALADSGLLVEDYLRRINVYSEKVSKGRNAWSQSLHSTESRSGLDAYQTDLIISNKNINKLCIKKRKTEHK